jgi:hypothetical protein
MTTRILLEKQQHEMFGNKWVSIKAFDSLNIAKPSIITRNGTKFLSKDINLAKTILKERIALSLS